MPGPVIIFTTLGAVGACGAAAYATKNNQCLFSFSNNNNAKITQRNQTNRIISNHGNNNKINKLTTTNRKFRIGHRNDLHVLMFVMGKD